MEAHISNKHSGPYQQYLTYIRNLLTVVLIGSPNSFYAIRILLMLIIEDNRTSFQERRNEIYEEVKRTRHNLRPCCGTHLDL